jgi:NADH-quinone oxidoreductase subunit N
MVIDFLAPVFAETGLAAAALLVVVGGAFTRGRAAGVWFFFALVALAVVGAGLVRGFVDPQTAFGGMFVHDNMAVVFKVMIAVAGFVSLVLAWPYFRKLNDVKFEYPLLVLLATVGMFAMVSAADLLVLYVGLELQSLALYVLAAFRRDVRRNSEAGLKYFFLGALSSGLLLYGISLVYGFVGSTSYATITTALAGNAHAGAVVGLVLTLAGLAFKISAAPFHMWTPDVYQGAPTPVTAFFSIGPKAAAIAVLCRLCDGPFGALFDQTQQILVILAVASMLVGAFAAIAQRNLKRLLAYSAIGHIGFILLGLAAGTDDGLAATILYTALYIIMGAGGFAFVLAAYGDADGEEDINALAGYARAHPVLAAAFSALLFSMAGIPPLAGFFAKLVVLKAAVEANLTWLVVVGVLCSVVSAFYYIRIIKIMYFDAPEAGRTGPTGHIIYRAVAVVAAIAMIALLVAPRALADIAAWAVL